MKVKKLIPIMLSFLMAGSLFFGCSSTPNNPDNTDGTGTQDPETPDTPDTPGENPDTPGVPDNPGDNPDNPTDPGDTPTDPGDNPTDPGDTPTDPGTPVDPEPVEPTDPVDPVDPEPVPDSTPLPAGNKIYVVGDSTVCSFNDDYYLPRYGYGTQLADYLNVTSDQIVNLALSGRSSKSFLTEENYTTLKNSIAEGDYLIIGFGHNDEKSAEPARFTDPNGTKEVENTSKGTSLKWCLYENYIKLATEKGATPILCTPIVRYSSSADYSADKAHVTADGNYPEAIKQLGEETGTTVIDLTTLTKELYLSDNANAIYYHAHTTYAGDIKTTPYDGTEIPDGRDDTHINMYGAKVVAYEFAKALQQTDCSLRSHINNDITAPRKIVAYPLAIKQSYVKTPYTPFDPAEYVDNKLFTSTTGTTSADWYKTAMGQLGGVSKVANYSFTENNGTVTMVTDSGSKFAASQDGFGAVFVQVDASQNFKASAKVTVTAAPASLSAQNAFGMMLRDDILIDTHDATLASNFVAASINGKGQAFFSRTEKTALSYDESKSLAFAQNVEYEVSIERIGQTVVATVKQGTTVLTTTYTDFDFVARDKDYMYLCMFASRSLTAQFSDIQFEITGISQGA